VSHLPVAHDADPTPADPADSGDPSELAGPSSGDPRSVRHLGLVLGVAAAVLLLDQLTKWWALDALSTHTIHVVWTLHLNLVRNAGSAFSVVKSGGQFIAPLAVIVVVWLLWQGRSASSLVGAVALGLVLGGAIGNLVDRALRSDAGFMQGRVIDFIDFQWWPVFNVADMGVVVGGILLVVVYAFGSDDGVAS
jgi:signal peptidase II